MVKVRTTKPTATETTMKTNPKYKTLEVEIRLTGRFNLEHLDQQYKYNSVEVTYGERASIPEEIENPTLVKAEFASAVRAGFDREMDAQIKNMIDRIEGNG